MIVDATIAHIAAYIPIASAGVFRRGCTAAKKDGNWPRSAIA
jgi:hypothetical protein